MIRFVNPCTLPSARNSIAALLTLALLFAGCTRSTPPDVVEFKPPAVKKPVVAEAPARPAPAAPATVAAPPPVVQAPKPATSAPAPVIVAKPPPPAAAPAVAKPPSIIGAWQVVEMTQNGKKEELPPGMSMMLKFVEGGTVTVAMTGGPGGEGKEDQGTWSLDGNNISINVSNEAKSGTLTFQGSDRAIIDLTEVQLTLVRAGG